MVFANSLSPRFADGDKFQFIAEKQNIIFEKDREAGLFLLPKTGKEGDEWPAGYRGSRLR